MGKMMSCRVSAAGSRLRKVSWTFFVYVELAYHSECECESDGRLTHVKTNTLQIN